MNIQSISIVVPTKRCVNDCPFCISKMHDNEYENLWSHKNIKKRLQYAVNNGVNTCIITGTGEALQNKKFLNGLAEIFEEMDHPFPNVELQTTGVFLHGEEKTEHIINANYMLLRMLGVNTISLSVSDITNNKNNMKMIGVPKHLHFKLHDLISQLKKSGFNIRLSINMTNIYDNFTALGMLLQVELLKPDHITFREMYFTSEQGSPENEWVRDNRCIPDVLESILNYIKAKGTELYRLPYGPMAYSINGMSVVIDDDCMSKENNDTLKYVILREDGKLYCRWDDPGSLIF